MRHYSLLIATLLLPLSSPGFAQSTAVPTDTKGGIVKWVDDKGVTHYGDSVPPEYSKSANSVLNKAGRVVQKNDAFKPGAAPESPDAEQERLLAEQKHRDSVLLGSYTTEQEIDLAKERSTQMDESAIKGLEQRELGVKERLATYQKSADTFVSRKKPIPDDLKQDIDSAKGELGRINEQMAQKHKNIDETRVRFDRDKQRFHEIKQAPPTKPVAPPK